MPPIYVYALHLGTVIVYVGQSIDPVKRLRGHRKRPHFRDASMIILDVGRPGEDTEIRWIRHMRGKGILLNVKPGTMLGASAGQRKGIPGASWARRSLCAPPKGFAGDDSE